VESIELSSREGGRASVRGPIVGTVDAGTGKPAEVTYKPTPFRGGYLTAEYSRE
jgi:hypothetical protein